MFTFSTLDLFASFVHKSIWHFGVAWLISQYFSCRDLKPVAFLVRLLEDWRNKLDNNNAVGAAVTDLSKDFDFIPHDLLVAKLDAYGFNRDNVA